MKNIMSFTILMLVTLNSHADVSSGSILECSNVSSNQQFEIHQIALPEIFEASLTNLNVNLNCLKNKSNQSNVNLIWSCIENRAGEGRIIVQVEQGGFTGLASANVFIEQIVGEPKYLTTLTCK